jgi:pimeloyl-ACP methyl ester carboxylesterase
MVLFFSIAGLLACLLTAGFLYNHVGARRDRRRYTLEGRSIEIGDIGDTGSKCTLYVRETGSGNPTVLFESGIAASHLNWRQVQEEVSRFTATASYDRAGLGWSSPCRTPRTPANVAAELHSMLARGEIAPPYVLVGHSYGGLVMRRFALLHPGEVAGLVLVDPMRCEEWPPLNPGRQNTLNRGMRLPVCAIPFASFGIARLAITSLLCRQHSVSRSLAEKTGDGGRYVFRRVTGELGKMPREIWPIIVAHWSRPDFYTGMRSHIKAVPDTVREMENAPPISSIPILVLTPEKSTPLSGVDLARIGDNVQQVIAQSSAHWIHLDRPDLVVDSIRDMVEAASRVPVAATV